MIKLFLRQFVKHWYALIPILFLWILGGILIFNSKDETLIVLSRWFSSLPAPGRQKPMKALPLVLKAMERTGKEKPGILCGLYETESCRRKKGRVKIRLDLMRKACAFIPVKHYDTEDVYKPHWLKKRREWTIGGPLGGVRTGGIRPDELVEPREYWEQHMPDVLASLKDLIDASEYAYEITARNRGEARGKTWIIPDLLARYARALCLDDIALMIWGDYASFQENRAYNKLKNEDPDFAGEFIFPRDRELRVLAKLVHDNRYRLALEEYSRGTAPDAGVRVACFQGPARLACFSPDEARMAYNKLLYILPEPYQAGYRLKLGLLYMMLGRQGKKNYLNKALDHLSEAARDNAYVIRARMNMARVYILQDKYRLAREEVRQLRLVQAQGKEYRDIVRLTLMGMGEYKNADCFSDMAGSSYGVKERCKNFRP